MIRYLLVVLFLVSCATFQKDLEEPSMLMRSGNPDRAAELLKPKAEKESDDQLVYLLEYATALQLAKKYDESNRAFLRADKLSEIQDYHSLSRIAGSMLLSEGMVQYKGEDFEKVLINAFLAINYLSKGDLDEARVEARRINDKLYRYKYEAKYDYEQNPLAYYISAMIWESEREWDSAFLDYKKVVDLAPQFGLAQEDVIRTAVISQRTQELDSLRKRFPNVEVNSQIIAKWKDKKLAEVVVIHQQGLGPIKRPNPSFVRVPKLYPRIGQITSAKVSVQAITPATATQPAVAATTTLVEKNTDEVYSVQDIAIKTLDDAYAGLIAKRAAGIATKAVVADQIRQKNEILGAIAWIGMNVADQADLRQWSSLPQAVRIARLRLPEGTYNLIIQGLDGSGHAVGAENSQTITVKPGKKIFINWRSF